MACPRKFCPGMCGEWTLYGNHARYCIPLVYSMSSGYSKSGLSEWIITFKPWLLPRIQARTGYMCHLNFEFSHYILQVMIILEFMSNGDLRDFLIENRPRYLTLCRYFVINYIYISILFHINYKVIKALSSLTYLVALLRSHPVAQAIH